MLARVQMGAVCLPVNHCLPSAYLSSASNYWGVGAPERLYGASAASAAAQPTAGAATWAQRWLGQPTEAGQLGPSGGPSSGPSGGHSSPTSGSSSSNVPLGSRRTSFSCNDLETMAKKNGGFGEHSSSGPGDGGPNLRDMAPPLSAALAQAELAAAHALRQADHPPGPPRPKKVLFCCHGSRGDVQPLVALALGMVARGGYDVAFWTVLIKMGASVRCAHVCKSSFFLL